jgi:hypothetical protein
VRTQPAIGAAPIAPHDPSPRSRARGSLPRAGQGPVSCQRTADVRMADAVGACLPPADASGLAFGEDAVHRFRAVQHDGPDLMPVYDLGGRLILVADQIGDLLDRHVFV